MFAGPNGSGKSTLIQSITGKFNIGYFINADVIQSHLARNKFLDYQALNLFPHDIKVEDWISFVKNKTETDARFKLNDFKHVMFEGEYLICSKPINSYIAAVLGEFFRNQLYLNNHSFSFETVMSHPSKVVFLKDLQERGYKTYLYFICTKDPKINIQRVKDRFYKGGHLVDEDKIRQRYLRSLALLKDAFNIVDRAFIIDNSKKEREFIIEKNNDQVTVFQRKVPEWIYHYLLSQL